MSDRNRRSTRTGDRSARRNTGRKSPKKQKVNLLPVVAALIVLFLVVVGFFSLMRAMKSKTEETVPMAMLGDQPEFFSTIRPETMTIAEKDLVDDPAKAAAYFENSLFVGDSQMAWLQTQQLASADVGAYLEKALFVTSDNYSWEAMGNELNGGALTFNLYGEYVSVADAVAKTGAEKVFLLLGRYDLLMNLSENAAQIAQQALIALRQACPNTEIIVLTMTPNMAESDSMPSNSAISKFNAALRDFCTAENGFTLADVAGLFPEDGLPEQYCADPEETGRKLNSEGAMLVVAGLLDAITTPASTAAPTPVPTPAEETTEPTADTAETVPQISADETPQAAGRASITG